MHLLQERLLRVIGATDLAGMTLRDIGVLIEEKSPQKVKHHLAQLQKKGLIKIDPTTKSIQRVRGGAIWNTNLVSVPIFGAADCGEAALVAEDRIDGYLKVSSSLLRKKQNVFALRAEGPSMNKARIDGNNIEDGDYLIIDRSDTSPQNGDIVLSIIDGMANIKRFYRDEQNAQVILMSESTRDLPPIYIHQDDDFMINGKVIQIIKKPRFSTSAQPES